MPGAQPGQDLFQQAIDLFSQRVDDYASGIAQRLGQPLSGSELSQQQVLERWNYTPLGDPAMADMQYHRLVAGGMPPGQALDQVYPMRKMLISGPDLDSQIKTAQQIAGWDAAAKGQPKPEKPDPAQLPVAHWAMSMLPPPPSPPVVGPGPGALALGPGGPAITPPGPLPGPPVSPAPMPPLGEMPPVAVGAMPPVQPVPGVS